MDILEKLSTYTPQSDEPSANETEKSLSTLRTAIRKEKSAVPEYKNILPWFSKYRTLLTSAAVVILLVSIFATTQRSERAEASPLEKLTRAAASQPASEKGNRYLETYTYYKLNKQKPKEALEKSWQSPDGSTIQESIELPSKIVTNREVYKAFPSGEKPFIAFDTTDWSQTDAELRKKSEEFNKELIDPQTGKVPKYSDKESYLPFLRMLLTQELDGSVIMTPKMRSVVITSMAKAYGTNAKTNAKDFDGRKAIVLQFEEKVWGESSTFKLYFDPTTSKLLAEKNEGASYDDNSKVDGRYVSWTVYRESKIINTFGSGDTTPINPQPPITPEMTSIPQ